MSFLQKKWWIIAIAVLVIAVIVVVVITANPNQSAEEPTTEATAGASTETTAEPTLPDQSEETTDETVQTTVPVVVQVEILGYEFTLSAQMAEKIFCRENADTAEKDVEVYTKLGGQEYMLFTIIFDSVKGDIVHMLGDANGEKMPIAFVMNLLPEGLSDEAAAEFYIAQGAVNEVIGSIRVK